MQTKLGHDALLSLINPLSQPDDLFASIPDSVSSFFLHRQRRLHFHQVYMPFLELRGYLSSPYTSFCTPAFRSLGKGWETVARLRRWWWRRHIQPRVLSHHTLETNSDTLDNGQQAGTADSGVSRSLEAAADGEGAAGEETCDDWKLLVYALILVSRQRLNVLAL